MWHPESIFDASGHLDEGVVHAWLDDQLAPGAATQVEQHAASCAPCSAMVAEARGFIAGASRVMASLDEPAVGQATSRDALLGIVTAAGGARATAPPPARGSVRRWSTRRISVLAAAALVFVTGTLVLRDSGTVREMVQADQQAPGDTTFIAQSAQAPEAVSEAAAPVAGPPAAPLVGGAAVPSVANSAGSLGGVSGNAGAGRADAPGGTLSPAPPPSPRRNPVATQAEPQPLSPPPSPAPAPASVASRAAAKAASQTAPPSVAGATAVVTRAGEDRGADRASDEAGVGRVATVTRDAAARRIEAQADERRRMQSSEVREPRAAFAGPRQGIARTSAEIQAMVRMVSSCWRIADSDSVLEFLPPGSGGIAAGAGEAASAWIPGWVRIGADATNPDRIWWLPLADSVSARVRFDDRASPDLVITPRRDSARMWRVPRADSVSRWAAIPRGDPAEAATSVRCPAP